MPSFEETPYHSDLRPRIERRPNWSQMPPRQPTQEDTLKSGYVQIERKTFVFDLKENIRGRLLRITEETAGKRNLIIVPASGLREFHKLLCEMAEAHRDIPEKGNAA
jgi:hypothetical protein